LQRNGLDALLLGVGLLLLDFLLLDDRYRAGVEIGARIALARIGRDDRVLVQVVEFAPRLRVYALRAKFGFRHGCCLLSSFAAARPHTRAAASRSDERSVPLTA